MSNTWLSITCNAEWKSREEKGRETWGTSPKGIEDHHSYLRLTFTQHKNINNPNYEMDLEESLNKL